MKRVTFSDSGRVSRVVSRRVGSEGVTNLRFLDRCIVLIMLNVTLVNLNLCATYLPGRLDSSPASLEW
jgi:hypothetical protein